MRSPQKNRYEITGRDGSKTVVTASSYGDVKRAINTFRVNADTVQRIYRDGSRGSKQVV